MTRWMTILGAALLALVMLDACAAYPDLDYRPQPASLSYEFVDESTSATVLVRAIGIREIGEGDDAQPAMVVELRVINRYEQPVHFTAIDLELVAADLNEFEMPKLAPTSPIMVPPNESRRVTATFPFPPNVEPDRDELERLHLAVTLHSEGQSLTRTVLFQDIDYHRYRYRPYPTWGTSIGVFGEF